ncbi:MAG: hypothetical protein ACPGFB_16410 [Verrucomicrobiales bacterium]
MLTDQVFVRLSYNYLGSSEGSGFASFSGANVRQDLDVEAHSSMVELGRIFDVSEQIFIEGSVNLGVGIVTSEGAQGRNLGGIGTFPRETSTNFAVGATLGVGYRLTENTSFLVSGDVTYVGTANTGLTANPLANAQGMNENEQLRAELYVYRVMAGLRYSF